MEAPDTSSAEIISHVWFKIRGSYFFYIAVFHTFNINLSQNLDVAVMQEVLQLAEFITNLSHSDA